MVYHASTHVIFIQFNCPFLLKPLVVESAATSLRNHQPHPLFGDHNSNMLRAPCQRVAAGIMGVSSFRSLTAQLHSWSAQLGGTGCSEAGGVTSSSRREFAAAAGGDSNEEVRVRGIDMICSYTLLHPQGPRGQKHQDAGYWHAAAVLAHALVTLTGTA